METTSSATRTIKLSTSDDIEFEVENDVAKMSVTIKNMLEGIYIC
jgi:phosphate uptake regulator